MFLNGRMDKEDVVPLFTQWNITQREKITLHFSQILLYDEDAHCAFLY